MSAGVRPLVIGDGKLFLGTDSETMPSPFELCLKGDVEKNVATLHGIFVELARLFWCSTASFVDKLPATIRWTPNPVTTGIAIDAEYNFSDVYKDPKNLIGIKVGALAYAPTSGTPETGLVRTNLDTSVTQYSQTCTGAVVFRHIGTTDAQSIAMADETLDLLRAFSPVIRSDLCFKAVNIASRTPLVIAPLKWYGKERFSSDVVVKFEFEDTWTLKRECPKLREIIFSTGQAEVERFIIPTDQRR